MSVVLREYVTKGLFLGLWAYLAVVQPLAGDIGRVVAWAAAGLGVGLVLGAGQQVLRGYRPGRNPLGFALLVLMDSPFFIYLGLVGGLGVGLVVETNPPPTREWLGWFAVGGAVLGYGFYQLTKVRDWRWRFGLGLLVGGLLMYLGFTYLMELDGFDTRAARRELGATILLGLPFFYLLTFCGEAEESEVEIAALSAGLGLGLYLLAMEETMPVLGNKAVLLLPVSLYFVYSTRVLPGLRVFKHNLRGYGYLSLGRVRDALLSFGRALSLNPQSDLAAQGLWDILRKVDISQLDEPTVRLLPFDFCLDKASGLLIGERVPTPVDREQAGRMLDLVERQRPGYAARVDYLRAVSLTHGKQFDEAAATLHRLLNPTSDYDTAARHGVLFDAWDLSLRLHPEIVKRVGPAELDKPGRRVDAIRAVERRLARDPEDPTVLELKRSLYAGLTEAEFLEAAAVAPPTEFNYDTVEQLGLALADDPDPARVDRGLGYLRIAVRGLPLRAPGIYRTLAEVSAKRGDSAKASEYLSAVKGAGQAVGVAELPADQRDIYVATLKELSNAAADRGDFAAAVADYRLYIEATKEDVDALRRLAELHANNDDALNAVLITERGLLYSKKDADLLAKKDSYYYSVGVDRVTAVRDKVKSWFDVAYCVGKAKQVADQKEADLDTLDYGLHLAQLARAVRPDSQSATLMEARLRLRKGERDTALARLEDLREMPRGSGEDEDAWYIGNRLLADIYLDDLDRPDLAIACLKDFRDYQKSGADSLYRLGQAYEASGDRANAKRNYDLVTAYKGHPRYWDATEASRRMAGD